MRGLSHRKILPYVDPIRTYWTVVIYFCHHHSLHMGKAATVGYTSLRGRRSCGKIWGFSFRARRDVDDCNPDLHWWSLLPAKPHEFVLATSEMQGAGTAYHPLRWNTLALEYARGPQKAKKMLYWTAVQRYDIDPCPFHVYYTHLLLSCDKKIPDRRYL